MEKRSVTGYCAGADGGNEKFHELDIPHSGFYAEGAGATFYGEYKKEELYKVVSFGERHGFKVFSWQFPNMTQELAQELLPECPKEELPITRNKMMRKKNFRCISISPIRVRKSFWQHSGRIVWMQVFVEVWLTLEMLYRTRQFL